MLSCWRTGLRALRAWSSRSILCAAVCCGSALASACDDHHDEEGDQHGEGEGTPTGSTCPEGNTLTYETFGREFMERYCTRCHSSALAGADRNGAPDGHDFDTLQGVLVVGEHVDQYAAAGPDAVNILMPKSGPMPTEEERRQLGEWLACEGVGE